MPASWRATDWLPSAPITIWHVSRRPSSSVTRAEPSSNSRPASALRTSVTPRSSGDSCSAHCTRRFSTMWPRFGSAVSAAENFSASGRSGVLAASQTTMSLYGDACGAMTSHARAAVRMRSDARDSADTRRSIARSSGLRGGTGSTSAIFQPASASSRARRAARQVPTMPLPTMTMSKSNLRRDVAMLSGFQRGVRRGPAAARAQPLPRSIVRARTWRAAARRRRGYRGCAGSAAHPTASRRGARDHR